MFTEKNMGKFREKISIFRDFFLFVFQNGKKSHFLKMLNFALFVCSVGTDKWAFERPMAIGHEVQINVYFYGVFFH